uniref:RT07405p n=1 Tax=Drosophila melanogaster TaxID=7227 RepID=D5SHI9_DROME|nr:RT07405p [Drosophila melanogaster]
MLHRQRNPEFSSTATSISSSSFESSHLMSSSEFSRAWHFARFRDRDDRFQHIHFAEDDRNGFETVSLSAGLKYSAKLTTFQAHVSIYFRNCAILWYSAAFS